LEAFSEGLDILLLSFGVDPTIYSSEEKLWKRMKLANDPPFTLLDSITASLTAKPSLKRTTIDSFLYFFRSTVALLHLELVLFPVSPSLLIFAQSAYIALPDYPLQNAALLFEISPVVICPLLAQTSGPKIGSVSLGNLSFFGKASRVQQVLH